MVISLKHNQARSVKRNFMASENSSQANEANGLGPFAEDSSKLVFMMTSQSFTMNHSLDASSIHTLTKKEVDTGAH